MNPIKFMVSTSYADAMKELTKEQRCDLYDAIFKYAVNQEVPKLSKELAIAFSFIKVDLDINLEATERRKARLRENGAKGGKRTQAKRREEGEND